MATLIPALGACVSRMTAGDTDEDDIPLVKPISCGREGDAPKEGHAWGDMSILCPDYSTRDLCAQVLHQRQMPMEMRRSPGDFDPTSDTIKVMTMKVSKGLEFPVVALAGVGYMPAKGEDEQEAARVLCGCDKGYAEVGDWGGWGLLFCEEVWASEIVLVSLSTVTALSRTVTCIAHSREIVPRPAMYLQDSLIGQYKNGSEK